MTTHNVYTISSTVATCVTAGPDSGFDITIQNVNESDYLYIGAENVTPSNYGYRIAPKTSWSVELSGEDDLWVIGSSNGILAAVLRVNLERTF